MDTYVHKLIEHFTNRLVGIIKFKNLVRSITLDAWEIESYGRKYYRAVFETTFIDKAIETLPIEQIKEIDDHFADNVHVSGVAFVSYITESNHYNHKKYDDEQYLKRLKEFDDSYTLLGSFITSFLEACAPDIIVYAKSLDSYPQFNYVRKFYREQSLTTEDYKHFYRSDFYRDVRDYSELYNRNKKIDKERFLREKITITDEEISKETWIYKENIRKFALACKVPFIAIGGKTLDAFYFDMHALMDALQDERNSDHIKNIPGDRLSIYIEKRLREHKKQLPGKQLAFLKKYPIQYGDIILLHNEKIGIVTIVELKNNVVFFEYKIVRTNLSPGRHSSSCQEKDVFKVLPGKELERLKTRYDWRSIDQLRRYFGRRVKEIKFTKAFKSITSNE